jgi:uncharacterized membrane protein YcaP (DUF421 family)
MAEDSAMISDQFTISTQEALAVIIAAAGIYLVFLALVRFLGARTLTSLSLVDFAAIVAVGAIIGRTTLLQQPRLITGVLALAVLFALQWVFGRLREIPALDRFLSAQPVVLVSDGALVHAAMRKAHVTENELRHAARVAGVSSLADVAYMVVEPNGVITVIRADREFDDWLIADL